MSSTDNPIEINVYNELGQQVYSLNQQAQKGLNEWVIRTDKLSLGIYYLVLQSPIKNFHQKIVVFR
jgi:hypothetical protein